MAEGGHVLNRPGQEPENVRKKKARNIRELFKGRFTEDESYTLLSQYKFDVHETTKAIFESKPGELNGLLKSDDVENRIAVVTKDEVLRDLALRNEIGDMVRQFACGDCDHMWWKKVPTRKPVSKCKKCHRKYDPIPQDQEWGLAEFECSCGKTFRGTGAMGKAESECYGCGTMCAPARILPPRRRKGPRSNKPHTCTGDNCYNPRGAHRHTDKCVHPKSNPQKVLVPSKPHVSSGSTVDSFLDQDDLDLETNYEPSLSNISEDEYPEVLYDRGDMSSRS